MSTWSSRRQRFFWMGLAALIAAPLPSYLQYTIGRTGEFWAGLPLLTIGAVLLVRRSLPERRPDGGERQGSASFHELSAILSIAAIVLTYGFWLATFALRPVGDDGVLAGMIGATLVLAAVEIVVHILLALARPAEQDARDIEIARRSTGAAYFVLAAGGWMVFGLTLFQRPYPLIACAALGALVIADLVRLISQLVFYRIGP